MIDRLDDLLGGALERTVDRHHRSRLRRLGQSDALSPAGPELGTSDRPVRHGCAVHVLIDGDEALAAVADALAGARSHVHIAGWHLTPGFRLRRDPGTPALHTVLAELAERVDVRVLLWAGPPLPLFRPTRPMMKDVQTQLMRGSKVKCVLDARERTMHCHHEKVIVIDDEVAFVGGIDLSDLSGDRWDRNAHPPRSATGWHDVSTRLQGPIVADVAQHFRDRWQEVAREDLPPPAVPEPAGEVTVRLLRTVPEKTYDFAPRGEFSILAAYLRALGSAREFIYLENQFLWSTEIVDILAEKLRHPPQPDFRIVLVLPVRPSSGRDTTRGQLGRLLDADGGAGRLLATTVRAHADGRADPLYVHAKVGIVDDAWLTIGSANLNEHSLFNDTEVNIVSQDRTLTRSTRLRLWAEHLECAVSEVEGDPVAVIDSRWRPRAVEQHERDVEHSAVTHRLVELPGVSRRTERLLGPVRGLLVDG
ncbi:Phosphatidylserine/phosphatidylglycerophosphate/cardiolipin synthase [Nakamurella panacisegetis]|uniref:Phosphatidylserine/phosphatidylglycerophosphate/cardiolipin synthase n=1 Tax=Nakamurella panacisegetis TaxID=1090615 RepID=A0A1H0QR75_9ACTN|nr:phospholipase D family protein [Nakamurella panacisegetis]SDP19690.1 Phosphatidylserine/phosphatidylglycerophosphate/cardiolipin synthase [Nakamurella panacisegetis]